MQQGRCQIALLLAATVSGALLLPAGARAAFEDLAVSPRARALGEASTAVADDAWDFYYNPAGLPRLAQPSVATATVQPNGTAFNRLTSFGAATRLPGNAGGVAFGYRWFGVKYGAGGDEVRLTTEQTFSLSHGFRLFRDASTSAQVGWTLNFYNLEFAQSVGGIDPGSDWAMGLDIGAMVTVYDRTRVGFLTRNLNNPTIGEDDEELRQQIAVGLCYEPYEDVLTTFDLRGQMGQDFRFHGGLEMGITSALSLRAGIETDPNKLTGGFAIHLPVVTLDYGFSTGGGVLDSSHQVGLSLRLGPKPTGEEAP